jgi:hypothetical protein
LVPGQHLVVYADSKPELGLLHAPLKLNRAGDRLLMTGVTSRGARYLIDSIDFGPQKADTALARLGCAGPWLPSVPTPATGNVAGTFRGLVLSNDFLFAYPTQQGRTYRVEYKDRLNALGWTTLPPVVGNGLEQVVSQPVQPSRFYRVREQ